VVLILFGRFWINGLAGGRRKLGKRGKQPGAELSTLQPGERTSIYRDHRIHTYEFTGSERVRQSAEGNQAILDAAEQHDLVLTTCSGYWLIEAGHFSHTRYATFKLLPRVEPQHQWQ